MKMQEVLHQGVPTQPPKNQVIMTSRKGQRHFCAHHPDRRAHGRCKSCGKWLCRKCAVIVGGTCYCLNDGCLPEEISQSLRSEENTVRENGRNPDPATRRIISLSVLTISLCGIVFAVWALRELRHLQDENSMLRGSRLRLIRQLKNSNRELRSRTDTTSIDGHQKTSPTVVTGSPASLPLPQDETAGKQLLPTIGPTQHRSGGPRYHFSNGPVDRKRVALTFDGGSNANVAPAILDTLSSRSVSATIFLTGNFIRRFPETTRNIVAAGHECGNHTYNHPHLTSYGIDRTRSTLPDITPETLADQLLRTERLFRYTTGYSIQPLWRAPYGEYNSAICRWAHDAGFLHIGWRQGRTWRDGLDSNDWVPDSATPGYHSPEDFYHKVIDLSRRPPAGINGGIILMHLGTHRKRKKDQVHFIIGKLIDTLRADGYRFVTVSELVAASGTDLALLREKIHIQ